MPSDLPAPPAGGLDRGQALAQDGGEDADELAVDDFNTIGVVIEQTMPLPVAPDLANL